MPALGQRHGTLAQCWYIVGRRQCTPGGDESDYTVAVMDEGAESYNNNPLSSGSCLTVLQSWNIFA